MIDTALPRLDLHRHLDGNVRLQTILDLARQHRVALPGETLETLRPHVVVQSERLGLMPFLSRLDWMTAAIADEAAVRRVARENVEATVSITSNCASARISKRGRTGSIPSPSCAASSPASRRGARRPASASTLSGS
jgi:adenosine deaminase